MARTTIRAMLHLALMASGLLAFAHLGHADARAPVRAQGDGVVFVCSAAQRAALPAAFTAYLRQLDIERHHVLRTEHPDGSLAFTLDTPASDTNANTPANTNTLNLAQRPALRIRNERYRLPGPRGTTRWVWTVSQKEILLALLHPGRQSVLQACTVDALREQVALRQNMVAWAEKLEWQWPDGEAAAWNSQLWHRGTPRNLQQVDAALTDAFLNQAQYSIGCYTAAKLTLGHGILDYYTRVAAQPDKAALVRQRLLCDGEPLVDLEPTQAWSFEADFDPARNQRPGKLFKLQHGVAPRHFVPGDWAYFVNTDPASQRKTGYEGSNAIYLGRNQFADFYNDHHHGYSFEEKIDAVYQWRHGVFSRSRDAAKSRPLSDADVQRLSQPPAQGGLLLDWRLVPYQFGYETLPDLPPAQP